jgi:hypothetical protein
VPALLGITTLALLALWMRLRSAAIGPAIAAHLGYNAAVAFMVALYVAFGPK